MDIFGQVPIQLILFFIFYGITGVVPLIAALYLLLRRSNAIAPDVTPPVRLRRWAASFFGVSTLAHVWWMLFYIYSGDMQSAIYMLIAMLDCVLLFTTFAGTLTAMLQDRRRSVWPALVLVIPFVVLWGACLVFPYHLLEQITTAYILLLYVIFTTYMVVAIRQYRRWLNDNYADLENKQVWLYQAVALVCMLFFVLYVLAIDMALIWLIHIIELVLVGLLLWRVETLPQLEDDSHGTLDPSRKGDDEAFGGEVIDPWTSQASSESPQGQEQAEELSAPPAFFGGGGSVALAQIEQLLKERCVDTQLYLQHDMSLQQLAHLLGTNRSYLSQYFSLQGITYNTYINNLRIDHFMRLYREAVAAEQPVKAQKLANDSGYRSYSTFSLAFKQRTGQSVSAWMHE